MVEARACHVTLQCRSVCEVVVEDWLKMFEDDWRWLKLIDADWSWCWLKMIEDDWSRCWLTMIEDDWSWLKLIEADWSWCWLKLIETDWSWCWLKSIEDDWNWLKLILIEYHWRWLKLIGADADWRWLKPMLIDDDWRWLKLIEADWNWLKMIERWLKMIEDDWRWLKDDWWRWLKMIEDVWRCLTMIDDWWRWWTMIDEDNWRWLKMMDDDWWRWLKMSEDDWRWLKMTEDDWRWLKMIEDDWRWLKMIEDNWRWLNIIEDDCLKLMVRLWFFERTSLPCEVCLFLMAFLFLIVAFATAITAFHHSLYEFSSVDKGMKTLLDIALGSMAWDLEAFPYPHSLCFEVLCFQISSWPSLVVRFLPVLIRISFKILRLAVGLWLGSASNTLRHVPNRELQDHDEGISLGGDARMQRIRKNKLERNAVPLPNIRKPGFKWSKHVYISAGLQLAGHLASCARKTWALRIAVIVFMILVAVVLLNLLIAQLNMAYKLAHADMEGYARLTRAGIIVTTVEQVSRKRWRKLLERLDITWLWLEDAQGYQRIYMDLLYYAFSSGDFRASATSNLNRCKTFFSERRFSKI